MLLKLNDHFLIRLSSTVESRISMSTDSVTKKLLRKIYKFQIRINLRFLQKTTSL